MAVELDPESAQAHYFYARHVFVHGEREKAIRRYEEAMRERGRERGREWAEPDNPMLLYNVGCIYSMLGAIDEAIDCLERAVAKGLTQKGWYVYDSNLDTLRAHALFQALLERLS